MEIFELNKGIRAYIYEDNRFKGCNLAVLFKRELNSAEVTENALLARVMGLGCEGLSSLSRLGRAAAESFGGSIDCVNMKKGNFQLLEFYTECEGQNVKNALELLQRVIFEPLTEKGGFKEEYLERAKKALKDDILACKDDKRAYAADRLYEEMFGKRGAGMAGDGYIEDIEGITAEGLYSHYKRLMSQSEILIIAAGGFDGETVKRGLRAFDKGGREPRRATCGRKTAKKQKMTVEETDIKQSKLCMGIDINSDYYAALTANEIFGGGASSRLFLKVREKEALCYYITSGVRRGLDIAVLQCGISAENADRVIELVKNELEGMKAISDREIERAKEGLFKACRGLCDDLSSLSNFCLGHALWGGAKTPMEAAERIMALKSDDIKGVFDKAAVDTIYLLKGRGEGV